MRMTNCCKVSGTPEQIEKFRESALSFNAKNNTTTIDFHKIIPMPALLAGTGYNSLYQWCVDKWGTAWAADVITISLETPTDLNFYFKTNSSFPKPIFEALGKKFQDMKIWCISIDGSGGVFGYGYFTPVRGGEPGEAFSRVGAAILSGALLGTPSQTVN